MNTEDIHDLTKYSYKELEVALHMVQLGGPLATALAYSRADIEAEILRRSTPTQPDQK